MPLQRCPRDASSRRDMRLAGFSQHAIRLFMTHYHCERNHQGRGNRLLRPEPALAAADHPVSAASASAECSITIVALPLMGVVAVFGRYRITVESQGHLFAVVFGGFREAMTESSRRRRRRCESRHWSVPPLGTSTSTPLARFHRLGDGADIGGLALGASQ